ncbi:hypothetical protein V2A60_010060 [Cordyceps javanica]
MPDTPDLTTYFGNCHCGLVKFTAALPDLRSGKINSCNCSICTKNGYLLAYPKVTDLKFLCGEADLTMYRFGNAKKPHKFCPKCGTSIMIDFGESEHELERTVNAVNIRTFVGIEDILDEIHLRRVNGKEKLNPPYQVPTF